MGNRIFGIDGYDWDMGWSLIYFGVCLWEDLERES